MAKPEDPPMRVRPFHGDRERAAQPCPPLPARRRQLYAGFLNLRPGCEACGLHYAFIDTGDGPAVFLIMLAGADVVGSALIVEVSMSQPFWLHAALWLPLILATTLLPMRSMKSLLIALQFHHKAAEGPDRADPK